MNTLLPKLKHELSIHESKKYLKYLRDKYPNRELHHILGSYTGMKHTDLLVVPVTREEHIKAHSNISEYCYENIGRALNELFGYVKDLENNKKNGELK